MTPDSTVTCPPTLVVDGKEFGNYSDYPSSALGRIPLRTAVAQSCNTAFISERDRVDGDDLADAAASLGLGVDHDLGFPAYFGSVEPPSTETGAAADLIGQGTVLASPMAMAAVVASVQQGGLVVPRLVEQVDVADHDHTPLTDEEAEQLRAMLRQVVTEASGRGLADVPGAPVVAKTGTAEFEGERGVETHAWMVAAQGDLAVAAFVEVGASGSPDRRAAGRGLPAGRPLTRRPRVSAAARVSGTGPDGSGGLPPGPASPKIRRAPRCMGSTTGPGRLHEMLPPKYDAPNSSARPAAGKGSGSTSFVGKVWFDPLRTATPVGTGATVVP
ncbi:penicillin-binding transpeptidase domain-containing protein [Nocardioides sp. TF02-7]|uniref:penicillin-binding transpeptidase domain-containing protein n=1 Tax=Nocardioides sp. TF02-7 TaxID=2917724 RepID=UPI001F0628E1|nr:penicillin-binding transpeptidase domain-containing protein [Nocardioides sp. TF02-7]UMG94768.1 hypothetical protein MF408_09995 [Nocardioides sp. TF02-7]